jgi:hypothetical protein
VIALKNVPKINKQIEFICSKEVMNTTYIVTPANMIEEFSKTISTKIDAPAM